MPCDDAHPYISRLLVRQGKSDQTTLVPRVEVFSTPLNLSLAERSGKVVSFGDFDESSFEERLAGSLHRVERGRGSVGELEKTNGFLEVGRVDRKAFEAGVE